MTTTTHPSNLPEQEPTGPTAVVLLNGEAWLRIGVGWESRTQWCCEWGALRDFAAKRGGATLYDIADLPTGPTEVQKEAIRSAWATLDVRGHDVSAGILRGAFPEAFADDLVTAKWESAEDTAEFLRVASLMGARVVAVRDGVTVTGPISSHIRLAKQWLFGLCDGGQREFDLSFLDDAGWTITVTAPKPVGPGADIPDEVVEAALAAIPWASVHQRADLRAALAAADAKRAELTGGDGNE